MLRSWSVAICAAAAAVGLLQLTVSGRLARYAPDWPHRLTASTLSAYVNKTFGPSSRCLKVAVDDTAEAAEVVTMLHHQQFSTASIDGGGVTTVVRTIESDGSANGSPVFCPAYVVVGRRQAVIEKHLETFKSHVAERMLVIVFQTRMYIKPFVKVIVCDMRYQDPVEKNTYKYVQSIHTIKNVC